MPIERKSIKAAPMGIEGRSVTGVFCVHGHKDDGDGWYSAGDISYPGLFGDFTDDGRQRAVFLWNHRSCDPPIATIDRLFEVDAADLPAAVKLYAPDATGGVAVTRTYLETPRANEVFAGLSSGAISEMSYAYELVEYSFEEVDPNSYRPPIRHIRRAKLFDVSDVNWGMNDATSADGAKDRPLVELRDAVKAAGAAFLSLFERRQKEGRTFSAANYAELEQLAGDLETSATRLRDLLAASEPKHAAIAQRILLESQRVLAQINGVKL